MDKHERMAAALSGRPVDRTPVWFMRQAGRYLPEYNAVRSRVSFLDLCRDADLACEVTVQPITRFDCDAAIVFSDILTVIEAIGREVVFDQGAGPRLPQPVRSSGDLATLHPAELDGTLGVAAETIRRFRRAVPDTPILGFAGAPFTLLCYLVEGRGSKDWLQTKKLLMSDPVTAGRLLDLLADAVGRHLQAQIDAGAAGVQLFDTWAGALPPDDFQRWALPAAARALGGVKGAPRLYFTRDTACFLPWVRQTGADAIALDWRVAMDRARAELGSVPVQGNLDPVALFGPPEQIRARVHAILDAAGPVGHVFNLGHGVLPDTPIAGVRAMIDAVRERR